MYKVEVIKASVGPNGIPLVTMLLRYGRCMHSELLRHRLFSSSVASSRAKPISKYIEEIRQEPFMPQHWGAKRKGMQSQATEIKYVALANLIWSSHRWYSLFCNWALDKLGAHKQIPNRLVETHLYVDHLVTGTEGAWMNFFALRCGLDGAPQPEIQIIARMACRAYRSAPIQTLEADEWHLPYITDEDRSIVRKLHDGDFHNKLEIEDLCKISAARCARLSYYSFLTNKKSTIIEDLELFNGLYEDLHVSPMEHQAQAIGTGVDPTVYKESGNLFGWRQFRKTLPNEVRHTFDLESVTDERYCIK